MRIKKQINLATIFLVMAALIAIGTNLYGQKLVREVRYQDSLTREINQAILDLNVLVSDFRTRRTARVVTQFTNRIQSLRQILTMFDTDQPEQHKLVSNMFVAVDTLQTTFNDFEKLNSNENRIATPQERAQRVLMQTILSSSQTLAALSSRLSHIYASRIDRIETFVLIMNLAGAAFFIVVVFGLYFRLLTVVLHPLLKLRDSIMRMAPDDLVEKKLQLPPQDELEELSQEFARRHEALQQAEKELRERAQDLERSNTELEQFAYVASHDLQEPLRAVSSYSQLLQKRMAGRLDEKEEKYLNGMISGALRMQHLIEALLMLSRVTTRSAPFSETDCNGILQDSLENLDSVISESEAVITATNLPTLNVDRAQLTSVFQNLIGNSIKFCSDKAPRINIQAERDGKFWRFTFSDNGIGIEEEYMNRVFKIFQRLHPRGDYPGEGVGLSLCKRIIERHEGHIWIESTPGEGSTVCFTLVA